MTVTICKRKQSEQERDSTSNFHVETLKMKIMKLRKENEILRKQLDAWKLNFILDRKNSA